jgi:hypothetical protein|tara:strand:+ start:329 stop:493 length:165 start_codon:yes stop_codon:yes gene_type:complete
MKKLKSLLIFIPSIENGGVEKNLYLIANYLAKKNIKRFTLRKNIMGYENLFNKL